MGEAEPASLSERLASARNGWLTTVRADGSPHTTPIWFTWTAGSFWVCTAAGSAKARDVARRPRVSVALEDGDHPVVAEGSAVVHVRPFPDDVVAAFAARFGWDITAGDDPDAGVCIEVPVRRWLLGGPPDVRDDG